MHAALARAVNCTATARKGERAERARREIPQSNPRGTRAALRRAMRVHWTFPKVAGLASAAVWLAVAGCASSRYERTTGEYFDDKMLGKRVKHALNAQPVYKYPDVKVNTFRGVVQLSGFVASEGQREAATEIAERVRGVGEVQNDILVAPLERTLARDYIPGRDEGGRGDTNAVRGAGAPGSGTRTTSGANTNNVTR